MNFLKIETSQHCQLWNDYVDNHNEGTIYHLIEWKKVIEQTYNWDSLYYMVEDKNKPLILIPFFKLKSLGLKSYYISLPYVPFCGIIGDREMISEDDIIRGLRWGDHAVIQRTLLGSEMANSELVTMLRDLPNSSNQLWDNLHYKVRNQVRKARKNEIEFDQGASFLRDCYKIYSRNMKKLGTPVHPYRFYENIMKEFNKKSNIWVVKKEDKVIGAMMVLFYKDTVYNYIASTLPEYHSTNANMMLYWGALKKSIELGFKKFDFGRSRKDSGTFRFKKQWGAMPQQLYYYSIINEGKHHVDLPSPRLLSKTWSRLPDFITSSLGQKIRKYIP